MVSDAQVRKLRKKLSEGKTVLAAADAAGMSEKSAHKWKTGPLPSGAKQPRHWRTRKDPFAEVWEEEIVPLLSADERSELDAKALLRVLEEKHPGDFNESQLRTLQRRVSEWRALYGPDQEVFFPQEHPPGRQGCFDFTSCNELEVTINGVVFAHLLFEFVLSYSGWRAVTLAFTETFEAMRAGLQHAVWKLQGTPAEWRSDNLSAATHDLPGGGRELTRRYQELLTHYEVRATRIQPGCPNQNGVAESNHRTLKRRLTQALVLRGSRDFRSVEEYEHFVQREVDGLNNERAALLATERAHLRPLPTSRLPEYTTFRTRVKLWSTVHFASRTYSVPSRLKGKDVEVRLFADTVEIWYANKLTATMPRIRGDSNYRIDYRHVIWSLVTKPGAFARYKYREELFPSMAFRRAYDSLVERRGDRADIEYLRILHLAASTIEIDVEAALEVLLEQGAAFDYAAVKALIVPDRPSVPDVQRGDPDPSEYDALLAGSGA